MKKFTLTLMAALFGLFANAAITTVDDLAGTYEPTISGWQWFNYATWESFTGGYSVTIEKASETSVTISNLMGYNSSITATVDFTAKTLTAAPLAGFNSWFTLADTTSVTGNIVGSFTDEGVITFDNLQAWYDNTGYLWSAKVVLNKPVVGTLEWSVEGTLCFYNGETMYRSAKTTLGKYTGSDKYDYALKFETGTDPGEMRFKVYGDSLGIANGIQYEGYAGAYFYNIYDGNQMVWLETTTDLSKFEGTQDGGELYVYCFDYITGTSTADKEGKLYFAWGTKDGIAQVEADAVDAPIYNLLGQKVKAADKPGIYLQGGKKFVVR